MYQLPGPFPLILKVKDPTVILISQWRKNVGINKGRIRAKINYLSLMYMHSLFTYILYIVKSIHLPISNSLNSHVPIMSMATGAQRLPAFCRVTVQPQWRINFSIWQSYGWVWIWQLPGECHLSDWFGKGEGLCGVVFTLLECRLQGFLVQDQCLTTQMCFLKNGHQIPINTDKPK